MSQRQGLIKSVGKSLKKASPTILSCLGAIGVVATAALAIKATPKALKHIEDAKEAKKLENDGNLTRMETIAACWTCYAPAAATGIATIGCILGINVLNRHQQASLASAYALVSRQYSDYKRKVKELYGKKAHEQVMRSLSVETSEPTPIHVGSAVGGSSLEFEDAHEEIYLFYDSCGERYFESTIGQVLQAEYHLNRKFMLGGYASLNEFYKFLGIDETELGEQVGWSSINGDMFWIDFDHSKALIDDGPNGEVECYIIDSAFLPEDTYLDDI